MKVKIIGVIITVLFCASIIVVGIVISVKNSKAESDITEENVSSDTTSMTESKTKIMDNGVVFETELSDNNGDTVTSAPSDNENNTSKSDNRIYVEDDSVFSGGYFEWR